MLDPATVQILFADLQPPIVARSKTNPPQSLACAASVLAQCARLAPVIAELTPRAQDFPPAIHLGLCISVMGIQASQIGK